MDKAQTPDQEITLHYIDELFAARNTLTSSAGRLGLTVVILSLVLLAISGSVALVDRKLDILGLGINVPLRVPVVQYAE